MEPIKDKSFGVMPIFKNTEGNFLFCLVQHQGEHWGFPKGHPNPGEPEEETAKRELGEETGITDIKIISGVSFNQQYTFEKDGIVYDKSVKYFPGFVSDINTSIPDDFKHEISEMKWLPFKEARELITFDNAKVLFDELGEYLNRMSFT
ncbi:MAG TPA: NUDIX domain-containing protein [Candidatus Paceibacterota bacterium]|nr:NUDIX domain-containing protein [Candidatus Paceibacterota bacterium]HPT17945.1 NUDIX domain-containing protein [Candidatus Paceibacterota bacterium]